MKQSLMSLIGALLVCAGACATDDEVSQHGTAPQSSRPESDATSESEPPMVTLDNVSYDCGPTDAGVIAFEATADAPFSGVAELLVLDQTYGSVRVDVRPTPSEHLMDIDLSQEAFDAGEGLVQVSSEDGSVLANEPVVLRLEPGVGCG